MQNIFGFDQNIEHDIVHLNVRMKFSYVQSTSKVVPLLG